MTEEMFFREKLIGVIQSQNFLNLKITASLIELFKLADADQDSPLAHSLNELLEANRKQGDMLVDFAKVAGFARGESNVK